MDVEEKLLEIKSSLSGVTEIQASQDTSLGNQMTVTDQLSSDMNQVTNEIRAVVQNVHEQIQARV